MNPINPVPQSEDIRRQILDAAEARFRVYGYRKTTMAEIAEDADMSAGNLYRYFEDKQDIAAACAGRCIGQRIEQLRAVLRQPAPSVGERLERFVLTMLRCTHERFHQQKKISELIETVAGERPQIVHEKNEAEQALIAEILAQGNACGEFDVPDVIAAARTVHSATVLFNVPIFMSLYPLEEFEQAARNVVALLLRGLVRR
jgi:AcrR family transcriptional regulator